MSKERFIGSWDLQEWKVEAENGEIFFPFGKDAIGQIVYTKDGTMSVCIMKKNRPPFQSEDPLQGQTEEVIDAYHGFIGYCGRFQVNTKSNQVVHLIKISSFPNWVDQQQIRNFDFNGNELTLGTEINRNKHTLVWKYAGEI